MSQLDLRELVAKADESLGAAEHLLKGGYAGYSAARSYYSMLYAAEALILTKGLTFSKHSAVIAALGREFVKTGAFPSSLHRSLLDAFDLRDEGDYGAPGSVSEEEARGLLARAREFVSAVKERLGPA